MRHRGDERGTQPLEGLNRCPVVKWFCCTTKHPPQRALGDPRKNDLDRLLTNIQCSPQRMSQIRMSGRCEDLCFIEYQQEPPVGAVEAAQLRHGWQRLARQ